MKVLIQNCVTRLYLCNGTKEEWCADSVEARDFLGGAAAIKFAVHNRLSGCQLIMKFNGSKEYDLVIPLIGEDGSPRLDRAA
jgi:hypothetical protein